MDKGYIAELQSLFSHKIYSVKKAKNKEKEIGNVYK